MIAIVGRHWADPKRDDAHKGLGYAVFVTQGEA